MVRMRFFSTKSDGEDVDKKVRDFCKTRRVIGIKTLVKDDYRSFKVHYNTRKRADATQRPQ